MPRASLPASLKGYVPALARHLGISAHALYERQRALMRAGELDLIEGRGPGSGVPLDAHGIALLVIAVLATDSLSETEQRVREIANTQTTSSFFKTKTFLGTLEHIFSGSMTRRVMGVRSITVSRTAANAQVMLEYDDPKDPLTKLDFAVATIDFSGPESTASPLRISATLDGGVFQQIAADARAIYDAAEAEIREERRRK